MLIKPMTLFPTNPPLEDIMPGSFKRAGHYQSCSCGDGQHLLQCLASEAGTLAANPLTQFRSSNSSNTSHKAQFCTSSWTLQSSKGFSTSPMMSVMRQPRTQRSRTCYGSLRSPSRSCRTWHLPKRRWSRRWSSWDQWRKWRFRVKV